VMVSRRKWFSGKGGRILYGGTGSSDDSSANFGLLSWLGMDCFLNYLKFLELLSNATLNISHALC